MIPQTTKNKRAGARWEAELASWFAALGYPCERRVLRGANDAGDLAGLPLVVQARNLARLDIGEALTAAKAQAARAGQRWYAAIFKRRSHPVAEAYVVIPLWLLGELLAGARVERR